MTSRTVPSAYTVLGEASASAEVSVDNRLAWRKGTFWSRTLPIANSAGPERKRVVIKAKLGGAGPLGETLMADYVGHLLVPKTPEAFTYDEDGNLTQDGLWNYSWDGENRLIQMESIAAVPAEAKKKLTFAYDHQSRRIQKKVYTWNVGSSGYDLENTVNFVHDGWNLAAETNLGQGVSR